MLIRFAVENYNSFKERQIFSMVAGKQTRHPSHCVTVNGKRLLKSRAVWKRGNLANGFYSIHIQGL